MKAKALIPLLAVCALLVALVMMKRSGEETVTLIEQAEFTSLVPEELNVDAVNRIEVYAGVKVGQRVILKREGEGWKIASHFDARAIDGRPQQLLDAVATIRGEFRATASDEQLADYDLSDDRGYHFIGFDGDERNELFHVIVGKSPKYGDMFMRASGSNDVFIVNHNLRRDAFNYSLDWDDPPLSASWADKTVVSLKGDDYTKFELTMSDKTLVAERREKPAQESSEDDEASAAVPAEPETEWVVVEGGRAGAVHQTPFTDLTRYISNLTALAVVSPLKKAIWGLDDPKYFVTAHRENGEKVALTVSHQTFTGPAHIMRTDTNDPLVYSVNDVTFNALFASGGKFYDLPGLLLEENAIQRVDYTTAEGSVSLAKTDGVWTVRSPEADLAPNSAALDELERTLSSWQAVDYADATDEQDWANSGDVVSFGDDTATHTIALGVAALHTEGRYAKLDDSTDKLVMSQSDVERVFLSAGQVFETDLFTLADDDEIVSIAIAKGDDALSLSQEEGIWTATAGDEHFDASVTTYTAVLDDLESVGVQLADDRTNGATVGTITIKTANGDHWSMVVEEAIDGQHPAVVNGTQAANLIDEKSFDALFPDFESFKVNEEANLSALPPGAQPVELGGFGNQTGHEGHNH